MRERIRSQMWPAVADVNAVRFIPLRTSSFDEKSLWTCHVLAIVFPFNDEYSFVVARNRSAEYRQTALVISASQCDSFGRGAPAGCVAPP